MDAQHPNDDLNLWSVLMWGGWSALGARRRHWATSPREGGLTSVSQHRACSLPAPPCSREAAPSAAQSQAWD